MAQRVPCGWWQMMVEGAMWWVGGASQSLCFTYSFYLND